MTDEAVKVQYETYPYPERDPADETARLIVGSPSHLLELNHYVFAGRRDFGKPFRALVAGGGTGDAAIMLAQQLADSGPGEVVYLDLSTASRAIAEARAEARGLTNITFESLTIEDLPRAGLGPFDYVDCCGVLHHLADPGAGLRALASVLAPDGGMGVMLYGEYGRTGVYPVQDLLRRLGRQDDAPADQVALAKRLLKDLPATNWLRRNDGLGDHFDGGDAGLYDLLLHPRDRAYTVAQIADLAASAEMRLTAFVDPVRYDPDALVSDANLRKRLAGLDWLDRCAAAESLAGNIRKHVFYLVHRENAGPTVANASNPQMVPCWHQFDTAKAAGMRPGQPLSAEVDGLTLRAPLPALAKAMIARIDGARSIADIGADLRGLNSSLDEAAFARQFGELFRAFNGFGKLFLRGPAR